MEDKTNTDRLKDQLLEATDANKHQWNRRRFVTFVMLALTLSLSEITACIAASSILLTLDAIYQILNLTFFCLYYLCLYLQRLPRNSKMTWGYSRIDLLLKLIQISLTWMLMLFVIYEAVLRIIFKSFVQKPLIMFLVSGLSLIINHKFHNFLHRESMYSHGILSNLFNNQNRYPSDEQKEEIELKELNNLKNGEIPFGQQSNTKNSTRNSAAEQYHEVKGQFSAKKLVRQSQMTIKDHFQEDHTISCYLKPHKEKNHFQHQCEAHPPHKSRYSYHTKKSNHKERCFESTPEIQRSLLNHQVQVQNWGEDITPARRTSLQVLYESERLKQPLVEKTDEIEIKQEQKSEKNSIFFYLYQNSISIGIFLSSLCILLLGTPEGYFTEVSTWNSWHLIDPLVALIFSLFSIASVFPSLRSCYYLIMESVPSHLDIETLQQAFESIDGVIDVHDIHLWELVQGKAIVIAHVLAKAHSERLVLSQMKAIARGKNISFWTFQIQQFQKRGDSDYILCHNDIH